MAVAIPNGDHGSHHPLVPARPARSSSSSIMESHSASKSAWEAVGSRLTTDSQDLPSMHRPSKIMACLGKNWVVEVSKIRGCWPVPSFTATCHGQVTTCSPNSEELPLQQHTQPVQWIPLTQMIFSPWTGSVASPIVISSVPFMFFSVLLVVAVVGVHSDTTIYPTTAATTSSTYW